LPIACLTASLPTNKYPAALAAQQRWLHWLEGVLTSSLYPGAPHPRSVMALELLSLQLDAFGDLINPSLVGGFVRARDAGGGEGEGGGAGAGCRDQECCGLYCQRGGAGAVCLECPFPPCPCSRRPAGASSWLPYGLANLRLLGRPSAHLARHSCCWVSQGWACGWNEGVPLTECVVLPCWVVLFCSAHSKHLHATAHPHNHTAAAPACLPACCLL
jgi:hypothetical protein